MNSSIKIVPHINEDLPPVAPVQERDAKLLTRIAEDGVRLEKLKRAFLEKNEDLLRSEASSA